MSALLDAALRYAAAEIHVFPVRLTLKGDGRKNVRPVDDWDAVSTMDPSIIANWFADASWNALAIDCAKSNLVVIDLDGVDALAWWAKVESAHGLPATYRARTRRGDGQHAYYRADPSRPVSNSTSKMHPGVDTRGVGGFVFAPPTSFEGGAWTWVEGEPDWAALPVVPRRVTELLTEAGIPAIAPIPRQRQSDVALNPADPFANAGVAGRAFTRAQAQAFIQPSLDRVRRTAQGTGFNDALMRAASTLPQFVPAFWSYEQVWAMLDEAVRVQFPGGMDADDRRTVESSFGMGARDAKAILREPPEPLAGPWVQPGVIPQLDDDLLRKAAEAEEAALQGRPALASHLRLAEKFAARYAGELRYVHRIGWHEWQGTHWAEDHRDASVARYHRFMLEQLALVEHLQKDKTKEELAEMLEKQVRANCTLAAVRGVTTLAAGLWPLSAAVEDCDRAPHLFNTPTGTFDLNAGFLRPHDRMDMVTKLAGAGPEPNADFGLWQAFLDRILPDPEMQGFVRRLIGSAMYGEQKEHILPIWHGIGANGKSVLMNVITKLFGSYAVHLPADALLSHTHSPHPTILMPLRGARLAFASETDEGRKFNAALVKRLTGGDPITARRMRQDDVTWMPTHQLVMVTNYAPAVEAHDQAMWRRVAIVPFDVVIPEPERDPHLTDKLISQLPAVAAWSWWGWQEYRSRGLAIPDAVRARTAEFRSDSDAVGRFIEERCKTGQFTHSPVGVLYSAWATWSHANGEEAGGVVEFAKLIEAKGFQKYRNNGTNFRGIMIVDDTSLTNP